MVAWALNKSDIAPWCKRPSTIVHQKPVTASVPTKQREIVATDLFGKKRVVPVSQGSFTLDLDRAPIYLAMPLEGLEVDRPTPVVPDDRSR